MSRRRLRIYLSRTLIWGLLVAVLVLGGFAAGTAVGAARYDTEEFAVSLPEIDGAASRAEEIAEKALEVAREQARYDRWVAMGQKLVALTFDDGPSRATTPRLLDILKEKKVKATFFTVGYALNAAPELAQREEAEGHEVGSHTTNHINLNLVKSAAEVQSEVGAMNQIFQSVLGRNVGIMRPPYGNGINMPVVTQNIGMPMIHWSVDTLDWKTKDAAKVRAAAMSAAHDGAIILMHDIHPTTVDAVPGIIDDLRAQGYEFVTVSELARARGVQMRAGATYFSFRP